MSSRAASEAPLSPPRSPIHIRDLSPPPIVPNGKSADAKSIAAALLPSSSSKPLVLPAVGASPASSSPVVSAQRVVSEAEKKPQIPEPELEPPSSSGDIIDMETFDQILELDEDDTHDFSKGMVWAYFSQANTTFKEMDDALKAKDLTKLSSLGHFLKGSSAALGVMKVQATCEVIQHLGKKEDNEKPISETEALDKLRPLLVRVKKEYQVAEEKLKKFYEDMGIFGAE